MSGEAKLAVASFHIVDGGKRVNYGRGAVNHSCGSKAAGTRFKKDNLSAVALVASPPVGKWLALAWQRRGNGLANGWQRGGLHGKEFAKMGIGPVKVWSRID